MRLGLALLLLGVAAPAASAQAPPRHLFVIGDSLAYYNRPFLQHELSDWKIEDNFSFARSARQTARDLVVRSQSVHPLPPVIHVSSGTGDDPSRPERFRRAIRRVMRVAGPQRCVVWANIWRPRLEEPTFATLNLVLAQEDLARANLRVIDWQAIVEAHLGWLIDPVHVNAEGNLVRAGAVASEVRACRGEIAPPAVIPGPLPA